MKHRIREGRVSLNRALEYNFPILIRMPFEVVDCFEEELDFVGAKHDGEQSWRAEFRSLYKNYAIVELEDFQSFQNIHSYVLRQNPEAQKKMYLAYGTYVQYFLQCVADNIYPDILIGDLLEPDSSEVLAIGADKIIGHPKLHMSEDGQRILASFPYINLSDPKKLQWKQAVGSSSTFTPSLQDPDDFEIVGY